MNPTPMPDHLKALITRTANSIGTGLEPEDDFELERRRQQQAIAAWQAQREEQAA